MQAFEIGFWNEKSESVIINRLIKAAPLGNSVYLLQGKVCGLGCNFLGKEYKHFRLKLSGNQAAWLFQNNRLNSEEEAFLEHLWNALRVLSLQYKQLEEMKPQEKDSGSYNRNSEYEELLRASHWVVGLPLAREASAAAA
ncbi:MAG: hypothetical protein WC459_00755 [Patescibacteria group bacterium]